MSDKQYFDTGDKLGCVGCRVENCKYHGNDNFCHADAIYVGSEDAIRKAETYCGTFEPKNSASM